MRMLGEHDDVSALRNELYALRQLVTQLRNSLVPARPLALEMRPSSQPDVPSGYLSLYPRRIGFANQTEVEAAHQRDPADFIVKLKSAVNDCLVPYRWDDKEPIGRMKRFFTDAGITLDLLEAGDVQNDNFVAWSDLVVRGDMVARHLRAHSLVREEFVLYWTLLEICREYGIFH